MFESSQIAFPALLPNFSPDAVVSRGVVMPNVLGTTSEESRELCFDETLSIRVISSRPARMFPHWSDPPT